MRRVTTAAALFGAAILAACALAAEEPNKDEKKQPKNRLAELMKGTFQGEKSPLVRTEAELKREEPDWDRVAKDAKAFAEMGEAVEGLTTQTYYWRNYGEPKNYIKHAKAFGDAAGEKDRKAATEALRGIQASCIDCHHVAYPQLRDRSAPRAH